MNIGLNVRPILSKSDKPPSKELEKQIICDHPDSQPSPKSNMDVSEGKIKRNKIPIAKRYLEEGETILPESRKKKKKKDDETSWEDNSVVFIESKTEDPYNYTLFPPSVQFKLSTFRTNDIMLVNGPEMLYSSPFVYTMNLTLPTACLSSYHVQLRLVNAENGNVIWTSATDDSCPIDIISLYTMINHEAGTTRLIWSMRFLTKSSKYQKNMVFSLIVVLSLNETTNSKISDDHIIHMTPPFGLMSRKPPASKVQSKEATHYDKILAQCVELWDADKIANK